MYLLDERGGGRFLSEALPHEFPEGGISNVECTLWELYYRDKKERNGD